MNVLIPAILTLSIIAAFFVLERHAQPPDRDPKTGKPVASSAGRFMGWNTIYGRDGENGEPYMTRVWIGRLRLHIFHRGDLDEDTHDHPWPFWTFPLTSYVEEVTTRVGYSYDAKGEHKIYAKTRQVVPALKLTFRPATHCHRVLGAWDGTARGLFTYTVAAVPVSFVSGDSVGRALEPQVDYKRKIVTIVWRGKPGREWGFLKNRDGRWCWVAWRDYVFGGGKDGPCQ